MRKLDAPPFDPMKVFRDSVEGLNDSARSQKYLANVVQLTAANNSYEVANKSANWVGLPRSARGNGHALVVGTLSKVDFTELYDDGMVGSSGRARKVYDDILVSTNGHCPACGGLGTASTLDHYLPKAHYPAYSVFPGNLVPSCKDCNLGKNALQMTGLGEQPLHAYFDDPKFFRERWVHAEAIREDIISFRFFCSPPAGWSQTDKERVIGHFRAFSLGRRFRKAAGAAVGLLIDQRRNTLTKLSKDDFQFHLQHSSNYPLDDLNGWSRTMYACLAATPWFYNADFASPAGHMPGISEAAA
ncbi:HNH endonuclease signature motif containing protein [Rhizobium sp. X9]|uniref:HNH endonuclease n=1 Tax=Rhizobium sp. X9 TaxID=2815360 RepID=UPI001C0C9B3B|nr:HNH endonuclease signature motif containing protein [Rhizobium sp. X9]